MYVFPPQKKEKKQEELLFYQQSTGNHDKPIKSITAASEVVYVCMHLSFTWNSAFLSRTVYLYVASTARSHNSHNIPVRVGSSQMVLIFFSKTFEKGCRLFSICVFKLSIPICFSKFEKFL